MKTELSFSAENRIVLLYIGAKVKGSEKDPSEIVCDLVNASIKGMTPTFFLDRECYSPQELINVACQFLYDRIENFLYDSSGKINQAAFEKCSDPQNERSVLVDALKNVLDFKYFKDIASLDVFYAISEDSESLYASSSFTIQKKSDTAYGLACQELVEKAVRDYQKSCS